MPLTGLQIYDNLPGTNCGKCGFPTCLAFAMALAQGRVVPRQCPDISAEARTLLDEAMRPPMRTIQFGLSGDQISTGGEDVLFRHEKTFLHPPPFAILMSDSIPEEEFRDKLEKIRKMEFELLGNIYRIDILAIRNDSRDSNTFARSVSLAGDMPLMLISDQLEAIQRARDVLRGQTPVVLGGVTDEWIGFALRFDAVLVIKGDDLDELSERSRHAQFLGLNNLILYPEVKSIKEALTAFTRSWEKALKEKDRSMGFPLLGWAGSDLSLAVQLICKYAGIIVIEMIDYEELLPLITLRLNIYSDPRNPHVIEPGLYEVGSPGEGAPVMVTTNASLTYYMVQPEIEDSRVPSYLLVTDSDGLSVLSAWAADKFSTKVITSAIKDSGIEERVAHRKIIIPGCVASLRLPLEDMSGWEVHVGPRESNMIPHYLKMEWKKDGSRNRRS